MIPAIASFLIGVPYGQWWALFITCAWFAATYLLDDFMGHSGLFGPVTPVEDLNSRIGELATALFLTTLGVLVHKVIRRIKKGDT